LYDIQQLQSFFWEVETEKEQAEKNSSLLLCTQLKILHLEMLPKCGHSLLINCPQILCTADNGQFFICKQHLVPD